jgi:hypothetical protein
MSFLFLPSNSFIHQTSLDVLVFAQPFGTVLGILHLQFMTLSANTTMPSTRSLSDFSMMAFRSEAMLT